MSKSNSIECQTCINNLDKLNSEYENAKAIWQVEKTHETIKRLLKAGTTLQNYVPLVEVLQT